MRGLTNRAAATLSVCMRRTAVCSRLQRKYDALSNLERPEFLFIVCQSFVSNRLGSGQMAEFTFRVDMKPIGLQYWEILPAPCARLNQKQT